MVQRFALALGLALVFWGGSAFMTSLAADEQHLAPFFFSHVQSTLDPGGPCAVDVTVPHDTVSTYCGDRDGCTLRLLTAGAARSQSPPALLTIDATGGWAVSRGAEESVKDGTFGDGVQAVVVSAYRAGGTWACRLVDDSTSFALINCFKELGEANADGNHICGVRIDD